MSLSIARTALFLFLFTSLSLSLFAQAPDSSINGGVVVRQVAELHGYSGPSTFRGRPALVAISPDNQLTAISANERAIRVFSTQKGELKYMLWVPGGVNGFAFSPDARLIATRDALDKSIRLWDTATGKPLRQLPGRKRDLETRVKRGVVADEFAYIVFSPDGRHVLSEREDDVVSIWDVEDGHEVARLRHDTQSNSAKDVLKQVVTLSPTSLLILRAQYSPDGSRIITTNGDALPKLWDANTGTLISPLEAHRDRVYAASFSSNGTTVTTIGLDGNAVLWDAATGRRKRVFQTDGKSLAKSGAGMVLSRDERIAVTFKGADTTVWDATEGREKFRLRKGKANIALISPDGRTVVTAGEDKKATATFWDLETGERRMVLAPADETTDVAAFSPDGRILVTTSDKGVKLWNTSDGSLITTMVHARYPIAFSQDGGYLITGGTDGAAALYQIQ